MSTTKSHQRNSEQIRKDLGHPVIDGDGHMVEVGPVVLDFLKDVAGPDMVERYVKTVSRKEGSFFRWYRMSKAERAYERVSRPPFWIVPTANTLDRATWMIPQLLSQRLDEFGIDYAVLYTTEGLPLLGLQDAELRSAAMRAFNMMYAELFAPYKDRLCPAAMIPMHTPEAALSELDFAVGKLGHKAIMIEGTIRRSVPAAQDAAGSADVPLPYYIDPLALDSPYDYDPVWQKCIDLKVSPTDHNASLGWVNRNMISNYNFNHIGAFGAAGEMFCKALFTGGVTRRFPELKFAFLEGGVGWACNLFSDIVGHWEKRHPDVANRDLNPERIDREQFVKLLKQYGDARISSKADELRERDGVFLDQFKEKAEDIDEWSHCGITSKQDIYNQFVPNFFFGCEADDPMTSWAFNAKVNPMGAKLKAIFSSDIGHWDAVDPRGILVEAYEQVEHGLLTEADFHDFVFGNPVELHTALNPDFFVGTAVEGAGAALRKQEAAE